MGPAAGKCQLRGRVSDGGPLIVLRDPDNIQIELTVDWQPAMY
jgi:hypothetical protein